MSQRTVKIPTLQISAGHNKSEVAKLL